MELDQDLLTAIDIELNKWVDYVKNGTKPTPDWNPRSIRDYDTLVSMKLKILHEPTSITQINHHNIPEPQTDEDFEKLFKVING